MARCRSWMMRRAAIGVAPVNPQRWPKQGDCAMNDLAEMQQLLKEAADLLKAGSKAGKRKAVVKLERLVVIAGTLALTLKARE